LVNTSLKWGAGEVEISKKQTAICGVCLGGCAVEVTVDKGKLVDFVSNLDYKIKHNLILLFVLKKVNNLG
jgi:anaerobic selenocysteine-containing dehydrogenase